MNQQQNKYENDKLSFWLKLSKIVIWLLVIGPINGDRSHTAAVTIAVAARV